jgi:microcystin-dependent protein
MFNVHNRDRIDSIIADTLDKASAESKRRFLKEHNNDGTHRFPAGDVVPVGAMVMWGSDTVPNSKWLFCRGQQVSRTTYQNLFNIFGTTYGAGDGSTTFNLPDLQQRFPLGKASSGTGNALGATGGAIDHVHTGPSHTHTGPAHTHTIAAEAAHTHSISASGTHTHSINDHSHSISSDGSHDHGGFTGVEGSSLAIGAGAVLATLALIRSRGQVS